jgi:hypothetical protein
MRAGVIQRHPSFIRQISGRSPSSGIQNDRRKGALVDYMSLSADVTSIGNHAACVHSVSTKRASHFAPRSHGMCEMAIIAQPRTKRENG